MKSKKTLRNVWTDWMRSVGESDFGHESPVWESDFNWELRRRRLLLHPAAGSRASDLRKAGERREREERSPITSPPSPTHPQTLLRHGPCSLRRNAARYGKILINNQLINILTLSVIYRILIQWFDIIRFFVLVGNLWLIEQENDRLSSSIRKDSECFRVDRFYDFHLNARPWRWRYDRIVSRQRGRSEGHQSESMGEYSSKKYSFLLKWDFVSLI